MKESKLRVSSLAKTYEHTMEKMYAALDVFPWENKECYAQFSAQTFHMTKYTTRLAALTAGSFMISEDSMHVNGLVHLKEETGHENLALTDLRNLGFKITDFPEFVPVKLMIQSQYYFIQRHPSAHFGFVLPLESMAGVRGPKLTQILKDAYGERCNSFLRVHSEVDQGHVGEMIKLINMSPDWIMPFIEENLVQTGYLYCQMLTLASKAQSEKKKKSA